jgi:hypothetical protein
MCSHICRFTEKSQRVPVLKQNSGGKSELSENIFFAQILIEFSASTRDRLLAAEAKTLNHTSLLLFQLSTVTMGWKGGGGGTR